MHFCIRDAIPRTNQQPKRNLNANHRVFIIIVIRIEDIIRNIETFNVVVTLILNYDF